MQNLAQLLEQKTREHPQAEHLRYRKGDTMVSMTRAESAERSAAWAGFLRSRGIGPGDRVALIAEKCPASIHAFFAVFSTGAVAVPMPEELPVKELKFLSSYMYTTEMKEGLDLIGSGAMDVERIITSEYHMSEGPKIFADLLSGKTQDVKVILKND